MRNPFVLLVQLLATARLAEPVRLWIYSVGGVVLTGLVLGGVLTDDWQVFGLTALGTVLALPGAELARRGVYSPRALADAGLLDIPGRHSREHATAVLLAAAVAQTSADVARRTDTTRMRPVRA